VRIVRDIEMHKFLLRYKLPLWRAVVQHYNVQNFVHVHGVGPDRPNHENVGFEGPHNIIGEIQLPISLGAGTLLQTDRPGRAIFTT